MSALNTMRRPTLRSSGVPMINWSNLDPARIERAVKILIRRLHPSAQGVDGSGGDDGKDIFLDTPEGLTIFEIKSFSKRLTSQQKSQIKKSLKNASTHHPKCWILIQPLDPSPKEIVWFNNLRKLHKDIILEWRGRDWLDGQFSLHEDIRRYVEGSDYDLLTRASELNHEVSALSNGISDAEKRLKGLSKRVDELSPCYAVDLEVRDGVASFFLREKFPGASEMDPIHATPTFIFPAQDEGARAAQASLQNALDYGEGCRIPGRYIQGIDIQASEETKKLLNFNEEDKYEYLDILPIDSSDGLPLPATLEVSFSEASPPPQSLPLQFTRKGIGRKGIMLSGGDTSGLITVTARFDHPGARHGRADINLKFAAMQGFFPFAIRPICEFILSALEGDHISLKFGHLEDKAKEFNSELFEEFKFSARLVIALDDLQKATKQSFRTPGDLTIEDLYTIEMARDLATKGSADWIYQGLPWKVNHAEISDFLEKFGPDNRGAIFVVSESLTIPVGEHVFQFGPVRIGSSHMELINRSEIESAAGGTLDPEAHFRCLEGDKITVTRLRQPSE
ncbi:hypothetical protein O4J56_14450 [Nocardiopsis sp. RSe5-2]|uniref:Restriction endonuclease n=1 Tax=Nocardiopsis endophytica TaxID=3018445 RepID=A0ABT4U4I0_9ACTN|nr:hypothetical protein [Nocardiopsis endophytica]MDA2811840.1 hypothetical protein [Nocardiopsis endophytica]